MGTVSARLDEIEGVSEHEVVFEGDYVELTHDQNKVSVDEIMDSLEEVGYRPAAWRPVSEGEPDSG